MKTPRFLWLAVVLILAAPSLVRADQVVIRLSDQTVGCVSDPRNVPNVAGGIMKVRIKIGPGRPDVIVDPLNLTACWSGNDVANNLMDAIDDAAVAAGYAAAGANCGSAVVNSTSLVNCQYKNPAGTCGLEFTSFSGTDYLAQAVYLGSNVSPCFMNGVVVKTNAGNVVGEGKISVIPFGVSAAADFPSQFLLQVNPNGFNGSLMLQGFRGPGDSVTVTIDTNAYPTLASLQNAIKDAFNSMNITGLTAIADANAVYSQFPGDFIPGGLGTSGIQMPSSPVVRFSNVQVGREIRVKAVTGATVTMETSVPPTPLPGLSPWGLLVLFGVLLLAGSWILQRRHRLAVTG